jgi:hypothetical protein
MMMMIKWSIEITCCNSTSNLCQNFSWHTQMWHWKYKSGYQLFLTRNNFQFIYLSNQEKFSASEMYTIVLPNAEKLYILRLSFMCLHNVWHIINNSKPEMCPLLFFTEHTKLALIEHSTFIKKMMAKEL